MLYRMGMALSLVVVLWVIGAQAQTGRIVFVGLDGDLFTAEADGGRVTRLAAPPGTYEDPKWSPNGQQIAFTHSHQLGFSLYVMDQDGGNPRMLADDALDGLDWSPDGREIVYTHREDGLRRINVATGEQVFLAHGWHPAWSPDGRTIAYGSADERIYLIDPTGREIGVVGALNKGVTIYAGGASSFTWSPDSQRLVFAAQGAPTHLYSVRRDGTGLQKLVSLDLPFLVSPSWSSDGWFILYTRIRENDPQATMLRMLDVTSGRSTEWLPGTDADWFQPGAYPVSYQGKQSFLWGELRLRANR